MNVPALKKTARTSHQPPQSTTEARSGSRLPRPRREISTPSAPATAAGNSQPPSAPNGPARRRCQLGLMAIVSAVSNCPFSSAATKSGDGGPATLTQFPVSRPSPL
jgi:hypothetical protein